MFDHNGFSIGGLESGGSMAWVDPDALEMSFTIGEGAKGRCGFANTLDVLFESIVDGMRKAGIQNLKQ